VNFNAAAEQGSAALAESCAFFALVGGRDAALPPTTRCQPRRNKTGQAREIDALTRAFSVYRQNEGGTISHGLATALINRDGKIDKIWRGNAWTPAEVTQAIQAESK